MDEALSSSRQSDNNSTRRDYNNNRSSSYNGGSGVNRRGGYHNSNNRRHQPYNRYGNNRNNYRGGGGGRGGGHRHHNNRHNNNNYHNRQPNNRFDNSSNNHETKSIDPQIAMLKQLTAMVAKMSDLLECAKNTATIDNDGHIVDTDLTNHDGTTSTSKDEKTVVKAIARNIQDLIGVLCSDQNAPMFLNYQSASKSSLSDNEEIAAEEEAGPLATLITSCAATLPLQSPSYVGLTFGVDEHSPDSVTTNATNNNNLMEEEGGDDQNNENNNVKEEKEQVVSYKGFAQRCMTMATRRLCNDLDQIGGVTYLLEQSPTKLSMTKSVSGDTFVDSFMRCKLLLRYFALLAKVGIVIGYDDQQDSIHDDAVTNNNLDNMTVAGLLKLFIITAMKASMETRSSYPSSNNNAACESFHNVSFLLCALVLSMLPYTMEYIPQSFMEYLVANIEQVLSSDNYKSNYQPGSGIMSILLEKEIHEVNSEDGDDDDEEEVDDDDDDATTPCADTLQDLLRTVRKLVEAFYGDSSFSSSCVATRFSLLTDSPWSYLKGKEQEYAPMEGDEEDAMIKQKNLFSKLQYTGEPILISVGTSVLLSYLLSLDGNSNVNDISMENAVSLSKIVALQCPSLEGVVFGRISIFDPPPDDDDDDDEGVGGEAEHPNLAAYVKSFTLVDRYFLSEAVRDCLVCHKSSVSSSGLEKGSCKDVAEQIWGVCHLFHPTSNNNNMEEDRVMQSNNDGSAASAVKGVEYGIVETILSLIIQSPRNVDSTSPLSHVYLSRVLIELTKFQPSSVPQSLAVAIAALFNDFLPSFSPLAKENMSQWLAFHLTNTDYQWPHAYWNMWTPYVVQCMKGSQRNCRGEFVLDAIQCMASNLSSPELLVKECLPTQSQLCDYILGNARSSIVTKSTVLEDIEKDLIHRIWIQNEDPEVIREYLIGDEIAESVQNDIDDGDNNAHPDDTWWRTGLIVKSLLRPVVRENQRLEHLVKEAQGNGMVDSLIDDDWDPKEDVLTDVEDILPRYKTVILATIARDIKVHEENLDLRGETKMSESGMILTGEVFVLRQSECLLSYSSAILKSVIDCFVSNAILTPKAVIDWSIGGCDKGTDPANPITSGWWNYALSASRLGVDHLLSSNQSNSDMLSTDIGMIIDTGGDEDDDAKAATPSIRRMKLAVEYIKPLLRFTSNRVHAVLESEYLSGSGLLSHECADLKEGLKYFTRALLSHVKVTLKEDTIVNATTELGGASLEVEAFIGNSDL